MLEEKPQKMATQHRGGFIALPVHMAWSEDSEHSVNMPNYLYRRQVKRDVDHPQRTNSTGSQQRSGFIQTRRLLIVAVMSCLEAMTSLSGLID